MAVDESARRRDMYDARLRPYDQRVRRGGWVYYVRAVKWEHELTNDAVQPGGELLYDALRLTVRGVRRARSGRRPWIVAVVRLGDVSTWNDRGPRVVHQEVLVVGQSPQARIDELARRAQDGDFAPTS